MTGKGYPLIVEGDMAIITGEGGDISKYRRSRNTQADPGKSRGERVGTAYQPGCAEIIYNPA